MTEKQITITLTESALSTIGQALAELPFKRVADIIATIQTQFDEQVKPAEPEPSTGPTPVEPEPSYPYPTPRKVQI